MSQSFVIFPGGIGTALELMMVWQLLQVGFMTERPVVLMGEMWQGLIDWMRRDMVPREVRLSCELVVRESCGARPAAGR